ncbi:MAG: hypothetical protein KMY53_17300 [Desulfarculus sp.]|nr:hypothetical protein [Pseudomonadota bacterium]MBV1715035.1 hypothetical protein [Desulfarculus sp.]MBU4573322.1 hypothetical protein [Pseudomonadota bacterium]MBU4599692.1 hypothetical protein [Pseudomonadota bacterium]MBV1739921.1 hypothetical protein [Desulfarculus sp.]
MDRNPLPYENLGGPALDSFGELLAYVFLGGIGLVLLLVVVWLFMRVMSRLGWYTPTGPVEQRMGQLLILALLTVIMVGGVAVIFFWFALDPSPE